MMRAVADHGRPLVDNPTRLDGVGRLGLDETSFFKTTRLAAGHSTGGVAAAWQGKELLRVVHRAVGMPAARSALDRFYR